MEAGVDAEAEGAPLLRKPFEYANLRSAVERVIDCS
jgi:hypothetical protein